MDSADKAGLSSDTPERIGSNPCRQLPRATGACRASDPHQLTIGAGTRGPRPVCMTYRGRPAPFDLMAALAIEPAGLWGSVVLAAVLTKAFRSPVRPHGFSTKHLLYDLQGDLLEMRLGFLLGAAGLDHGGTVPAPACYGSPPLGR